jgi:hypothetical protein
MITSGLSDQVCGKTIRLSWTDGPTKGTTQEHVFATDGTVRWQSATKAGSDKAPERPPYVGIKITDEVCLVSYLSKSGYTLTVVLNFSDKSTAGVASNEVTWVPVRGSFEVM